MFALVTGGAGYFGECLVRKLQTRGVPVRVLDLHKLEGVENVESVVGDIRDENAVANACRDVTHIFHNVAQVPLAKDKQLFESVNHWGTENLLRQAHKANVAKVVYTSSSAVMGVPTTNPVTEETKPNPAEAYGKAKYEGEILCHKFIKDCGMDISILRPRTIVGHGRLGIFQILFEWIYQGDNVPVFDGGNNIFQFIHADDMAEACILAGLSKGSDVFNIGATQYGSMREMLEALCKHAGTGSKVKSLPFGLIKTLMNLTSAIGLSPLGPYHALLYGRDFYYDTAKAQQKLGWLPAYSNEQMILQSYDWYVSHRDEVFNRKDASAHRSAVKQGILSLVPRFL